MLAIIPKYCHYSLLIPKIIIKSNVTISHLVTFTDSCRYEIDEKSCVNKLFGVTHGLFGVHKESDRFGWTYNKETDKINIWQYYYANSKLHKKIITSVNINEEHYFELNTNENRDLALKVDNETFNIKINSKGKKWHIKLLPYFGGNSIAPHTIKIKL